MSFRLFGAYLTIFSIAAPTAMGMPWGWKRGEWMEQKYREFYSLSLTQWGIFSHSLDRTGLPLALLLSVHSEQGLSYKAQFLLSSIREPPEEK